MTFWTTQQLKSKLPSLIGGYDEARIDCNAYTLRIGHEVYVSPTEEIPDPKQATIRSLTQEEAFTIPPGQFAFLITEESIEVPKNAMAFISMKAKIKFRGLVNVSGFHVDPGYKGKLMFAVFNASPAVIHLRRGQDCFLIWYASLGADSERNKEGTGKDAIEPEFISALGGELESLEGLNSKIKAVEQRLEARINAVDPKYAQVITMATLATTLLVLVLAVMLRNAFLPAAFESAASSSEVAERQQPSAAEASQERRAQDPAAPEPTPAPHSDPDSDRRTTPASQERQPQNPPAAQSPPGVRENADPNRDAVPR